MKQLLRRQLFLDKKIVALEDDMMSLTKATMNEIEYIKKELEISGNWIRYLSQQIETLEYKVRHLRGEILDNANAITFLSATIAVILSEMERYPGFYQRLVAELDHLLDA